MGNPLPTVERGHRLFDTGDLPFVDGQVLGDRSAARNERLRPVFLASFSSRSLTSGSTRTVKVVEVMSSISVCGCTQDST